MVNFVGFVFTAETRMLSFRAEAMVSNSAYRVFCVRGSAFGSFSHFRPVYFLNVALLVLVSVFDLQAAADSQRKSDRVTEQDRQFWSFRKPVNHRQPQFESMDRVRTPIDAFILAKLEEKGLTFNEDADRRTLIRRLYYDILGLPPEPAEIDIFINDPSPQTYENLVNRVLESPHYGERWGRHWLDVAGFAESSLFIGDQFRPDFWRYRDYVIRSFNADKPFDQFVREQMAGDEMFDWRAVDTFTPDQVDKLVATGFLRCPPDATDNQAITQYEKIYATQQTSMEVSMKALMGLTLNCVRCHSHKYDPIPHEDYYRLIAVFQPAYDPKNWLAGIWSKGNPGPIRAIPLLKRAERDSYFKRSRVWKSERSQLRRKLNTELPRHWRNRYINENLSEVTDRTLRDQVETALAKKHTQHTDSEKELLTNTAMDLGVDSPILRKTYPEFEKEEKQIRDELAQIDEEIKNLPPLAWGLFDVSSKPSPTPMLRRGNFETPGEDVEPGALTVLNDLNHPWDFPQPSTDDPTTGRRLALAQWITRPENPLTARVMVNRIWQFHFGTGIVSTPDDFGARGSRPTHPKLLDWLAVEFMDNDWSVKHIHRLILSSTVFRQSSANESSDRPSDPSNQFLGRFPKRRLEAEAIRDAFLSSSGQLDRRQFGASVPTKKLADGQFGLSPDHSERNRRSIYISTRRTWISTFLAMFDAPIMDTNWPIRSTSVIPQQALAAMNNPITLACAEQFGQRVMKEGGSRFGERLHYAWMLAYGRPPGSEETALLRRFFSANQGDDRDLDETAAWRTICHALLSSNEFIYVD